MKFGFIITGGEALEQVELARAAEAAGWDGVFTWDGIHVGDEIETYDPWALMGAMALATKDVRPYHVYVGIPAKSVRVKPNSPELRDVVMKTARERGE